MTQKEQYVEYQRILAHASFVQKLAEQIDSNFLSEDFFNKILEVKSPNTNNPAKSTANKSGTLFDKLVGFAQECYIHGITVGINTAIEIYQEHNSDLK